MIECPKLDACSKIRGVFDQDLLEFQYAEAIRKVCDNCSRKKVNFIPDAEYQAIKKVIPIFCAELIVVKGDSILLAKRNNEPEKGKWALPGGRVLRGESMIEAVHRKAREELGIEVEIERQVGLYESFFPEAHIVVVDFLVSPKSDLITLDSQHCEYMWATELPSQNLAEPERLQQCLRDAGFFFGKCPKLNDCPKIEIVLDKDLAGDWQYAEVIRKVCAKCREGGK